MPCVCSWTRCHLPLAHPLQLRPRGQDGEVAGRAGVSISSRSWSQAHRQHVGGYQRRGREESVQDGQEAWAGVGRVHSLSPRASESQRSPPSASFCLAQTLCPVPEPPGTLLPSVVFLSAVTISIWTSLPLS